MINQRSLIYNLEKRRSNLHNHGSAHWRHILTYTRDMIQIQSIANRQFYFANDAIGKMRSITSFAVSFAYFKKPASGTNFTSYLHAVEGVR